MTSDLKANNMRNDLVDFKNNLNDMKSSLPNNLMHIKRSFDNLVDIDDSPVTSPVVKFPDDTPPIVAEIESPTGTVDNLMYAQTTTNNFKKTTVGTSCLTFNYVKYLYTCATWLLS